MKDKGGENGDICNSNYNKNKVKKTNKIKLSEDPYTFCEFHTQEFNQVSQ